MTGLQIGFDIAGFPGTAEVAAIAKAAGATWAALYMGGPESAGSGWTLDALRSIAADLPDGFLPIFVGQEFNDILTAAIGSQHGLQAVQLAQSYGFGPGSPIMLDVEERTYANQPNACIRYVGAFVATVRAAGYRAGVYGSLVCLGHVDHDVTWAADWDGVSSPEGYDIHQYVSTTVAGAGVDLSIARDGFQFARLS